MGTLVVVIGTNDLPGMTQAWAQVYPSPVAEVVGWERRERAASRRR